MATPEHQTEAAGGLSAVDRSVGQPLYAMVLRLQEPEITAHCFGDCGRAILMGLADDNLGPLIPCAQAQCPHLEAQMDEPLWTAEDGRPVYLRRLVPNAELCGGPSGPSERAPG